jgi:methyltransferase-like protein/2-polyprenyl-3-methyl-5-hydroxy-6-metoxy-1,4-benzoquinol methylase
MSAKPLNSYDLIPYPNYSFPQTHPDRAAVVGTLLGLSPPPVERCRVLELGCAAGSNLIPIAEDLPESTFLGIDLSQRQIHEGQQTIAELSLTNIELRHQSILDFELGSQTFDYILCHGVFSWVPPEVQDRILAICRRCLGPNGLAFVSYNTLPGWHMRGMIRDMMLYHGRRFSQPAQQVAGARGLLDFLVSSIPMQENPYGQFLRSELELLRNQPDAYLYHDHLEENNSPLYFHQFVERAAAHGLRYLADVDLYTMVSHNLPEQVAQPLHRVSADLLQLEQYLDFLRNRTFRQTLLCQAPQTPNYSLEPEALTHFFIGSQLKPASPQADLHRSIREHFQGPSGATAFATNPIVKAALVVLGQAWPQMLLFRDLYAQAKALLAGVPRAAVPPSEDQELQLRQGLLKFYTINNSLVDFRLHPLGVSTQPGPRPAARLLARWQAQSGRPVTNLRHEIVEVDNFGRQLLQRLDGQHSQGDLVQALIEVVEAGQLPVWQQKQNVADHRQREQLVSDSVQEQLERFARSALLLANATRT